jgi:hypothetical protein
LLRRIIWYIVDAWYMVHGVGIQLRYMVDHRCYGTYTWHILWYMIDDIETHLGDVMVHELMMFWYIVRGTYW